MKPLLSQPARRAVMIILAFLGFSLLWIPLTDRLLGWMVQDPATLMRLATYKGFIYLGLSSLLLFLLILSALRLTSGEPFEESSLPSGHKGFKTISVLFALAALVVALVALSAYRFQQASLERTAGEELAYLARVQRDRFEGWLEERLHDTSAAAADLSLHQGEEAGTSAAHTRDRFLVLKKAYGYHSIHLLDREGQVVLSTEPGAPPALARKAAKETGPHDGPRLVWELEGVSVRLLSVAPARTGPGPEPQGVLVFDLDLDAFLARLLSEQPTYRASAETHLACQQEHALHWLSPPGSPDRERSSVDLSRTELVGIQAWLKGDGVYQGLDYRGVPSIAAAQRIAGVPWMLYTKMDRSEAIAPLVRLGWAYACLGGLVLGLFGALLVVWWSRERSRAARLAHEKELLDLRLRSLSRNANDIVLLLDEDGIILDANDRAASAYGYRLEELRAMRVRDLRTLDALGDFSGQFRLAKEQTAVRFESTHVRRDGSFFPVEVSSRAFQMEGRTYVQSIIRDISERKASEELLKNSEERFRRLFEDAAEGLVLVDCATGFLNDCNLAFQRMVGRDRQALVGTSLERLVPDACIEALNQKLSTILASDDGSGDLESRLIIASGEERDVLIQARLIRIQGRPILQEMFTDLTEARRRERERDATVRLLSLLNEPVSRTHELIALLTEFLQEWTGCEAVGIRLREDEDYPYYETRGFPPTFVEAESRLCARDPSGDPLRDGSGNPVLECMCGNILCRRFDPSLPFFTARGSFWTNSTTHLLASTSEADRQNRTRNRCNGEGYESVALIPMISGEAVLGLMQLNDHAPGRFSLELIEFLEQAARQIALALAQRRAQEDLAASEKRFRDISQAAGEFLWETGSDGNIVFITDRIRDLLGYAPEEMVGREPYAFMDPASSPRPVLPDMDDFQNREMAAVHQSGRRVWLNMTRLRMTDAQGRHLGFRGVGMDITDRKRAALALAEREEAYRSLFENMAEGAFRQRKDGALMDINPAALRMLGLPREAFLARDSYSPAWDIIREDGSPCPGDEHPSLQALRTGHSVREVLGARQEDTGARIWMEIQAIPEYRSGEPEPHQVLVTLHDITSRKRAEDAVRLSEDRFRTVADHTYDWEYWQDVEGRFIYSSPSCERITGYSPEELPCLAAFIDLIVEDDRPHFLDHAAQAKHGPFREEQRFRIRHRDGRTRWIGHVCKPIYRNGEFLGIRGSNRDITDQIQARKWLQESEERLRRIINATQVGTWEWTIRTGEVVVNERWAEIIGYRLSELMPIDLHTWHAHVHPDDRKISEALLRKVFARETSFYDLECRMRHKDGHWVWILNRGQVTEWGPDLEALSMAGTHADITHLKLAEEALRSEEERYRTILQTTLDGFCVLDQQGRFLEVNSAFTRMSGYEPQELAEVSILDLEAAGTPGTTSLRLPQEGQVRFETRYRHKDGHPIDVEVGMVALQDTFIAFLHDITERKQSEAALKDDVDRLQAMLRVFQHEVKDRQSFLDQALHEAIRLTGSGIGYIYVSSDATEHFTLETWSRAAEMDGPDPEPGPPRELADTGLWDEVVRRKGAIRINDYGPDHPLHEGLAGEPVPFRNFLSVPVFYEERIVAVAGVADKEADYTERDVLQLTILMDGVWRSMMLLETFEVLKASEKRYANLFNAIQEGFSLHEIVTDGAGLPVDYRFLAVNPAFEQLTGIPRERWLGRTAREVLPDLESRWVETYGRVALTGEPVLFEDYAQALDRWYQVYAFSPEPRKFAVLSLDVTERKQAEDKVKQSEASLRALVESAPDPIFIQTDGRFAYVNPAACATFGAKRPDDLLGRAVLEHVHPADRPAIAGRIEALDRWHEETSQREDLFVGLDGRIVILEVSAVPFRYEGRDGALVFARDITARKALEAALVNSERFLRAAQAVGRIGSYRVDVATDRWESSAILDDILGIDPTYPRDLRGWLDLVSPDLQHELAEYRAHVFRDRGRFDREYRIIRHRDGQERWVSEQGELELDAGGRPVHMIGTIQDITDRKRAEMEIRSKTELLNLTGRMAKVGGWEFDARTLKGTWTDEVARIHDLDPADPTSVEMGLSCYPPAARQRIEQAIQAAIQAGTSYDLELDFVSAKGVPKVVRTIGSPVLDEEGRVIQVRGIFQDITELKQAQVSLAAREKEFRDLAESMPQIVWVTRNDGWNIYFNRQWTAYTGLTLEESLGDGWIKPFHPEDRQQAMSTWQNAVTTLGGYSLECRLRSRDGTYRWWLIRGVPFLGVDGKVDKWFGTCTDIDERKAMEEQIRRSNEELELRVQERTARLEAANHELEAFSYSVSHDLRAPLRGIDGFSRALLEDFGDRLDDNGRHYLARVRAGTQRMGHLIDDLLKLSRVSRAELDQADVDLSAMSTRILHDLAEKQPSRDITFEVAPGLSAWADPRLMAIVMENLLANAWKFTQKTSGARIEVGSSPGDGEPAFLVRDNGAGFDMAYASKLFGAFQRLHTAQEFEGTGIGLAIVQRIIHRHGGRIWAEGETGQGASFHFTLPS